MLYLTKKIRPKVNLDCRREILSQKYQLKCCLEVDINTRNYISKGVI